jgi:cathepsin B
LQNGPINVVIPLYRNFLNYKTGIFSVTENSAKLRAGVALNVIGWDSSADGQKYWIVENFWGDNWGQNGIAHIAIGI